MLKEQPPQTRLILWMDHSWSCVCSIRDSLRPSLFLLSLFSHYFRGVQMESGRDSRHLLPTPHYLWPNSTFFWTTLGQIRTQENRTHWRTDYGSRDDSLFRCNRVMAVLPTLWSNCTHRYLLCGLVPVHTNNNKVVQEEKGYSIRLRICRLRHFLSAFLPDCTLNPLRGLERHFRGSWTPPTISNNSSNSSVCEK